MCVRVCVCLIIMLQFLLLLRRHRIHRPSPWEGNTRRSTDPCWKMQNKAARISLCQSLVISFTLWLLDGGSFFSPVTSFLCLRAASCVGMAGRTYSFRGAGSVRCPRFLWEPSQSRGGSPRGSVCRGNWVVELQRDLLEVADRLLKHAEAALLPGI